MTQNDLEQPQISPTTESKDTPAPPYIRRIHNINSLRGIQDCALGPSQRQISVSSEAFEIHHITRTDVSFPTRKLCQQIPDKVGLFVLLCFLFCQRVYGMQMSLERSPLSPDAWMQIN